MDLLSSLKRKVGREIGLERERNKCSLTMGPLFYPKKKKNHGAIGMPGKKSNVPSGNLYNGQIK